MSQYPVNVGLNGPARTCLGALGTRNFAWSCGESNSDPSIIQILFYPQYHPSNRHQANVKLISNLKYQTLLQELLLKLITIFNTVILNCTSFYRRDNNFWWAKQNVTLPEYENHCSVRRYEMTRKRSDVATPDAVP